MKDKSVSLDVENARNLTMEQLSSMFISTCLYKKLLSRGHHILLGARGQGKTALFRMLAFEGFRTLAKNDSWAEDILSEKKFIGIYLPTKLEWVQSLTYVNNEHLSENDAFRWKFNLSSCIAFIDTALACIEEYGGDRREVILKEMEFSSSVASIWQLGAGCDTLEIVASRLRKVGYQWQVAVTKMSMFGLSLKDVISDDLQAPMSVFATNAFSPLKHAIDILARLLDFPKTTSWLLCIDEAEYMTGEQQCIINTFMRGAPENLFIKIATMPFSHYTLETDFPEAPLRPGNDFEYLMMDKEMKYISDGRAKKTDSDFSDVELQFGEQLLDRVISTCYPDCNSSWRTLEKMFGRSVLLDNAVDADWSQDSMYMRLFRQYASPSYVARAEELLSKEGPRTKFKNEVSRKIRGTLLLRENKDVCIGHKKSSIYSGGKVVLRCAENNPRMFIRIINSMLRYIKEGAQPLVGVKKQEEVLVDLARNFHNQIKSYQVVGPDLYRLVETIGKRFQRELYEKPLTGDVLQSIEIDEKYLSDYKNVKLIRAAIQYGVFYPNDVSRINYGSDAKLEGTYHLSYSFCPLFRLQPRMGKAINMEDILLPRKQSRHEGSKSLLNEQLTFEFEEDGV